MRNLIFILLVLPVFLVSCVHTDRQLQGKQVVPKTARKGANASTTDQTRAEVRRYLRQGNHRKTLELIRGEIRKGRPESAYWAEYQGALNGLLEEGMGYYSSGDYGKAGMAFKFALDNYPSEEKLRAGTRYSLGEIDEYIHECSRRLMEDGLRDYREGKLESAISIWKKVLSFDPDHREAQKTIETATSQLERLKRLD